MGFADQNQSFASKSTTSRGKIKSTSRTDSVIDFSAIQRRRPKAKMAQVVGSHYGLRRHIQDGLKRGYGLRRQMIAEHCPKTYASLRKKTKALRVRPGKIHFGDLFDLVTRDTSYVDYDDVRVFNNDHVRFIYLAIENGLAGATINGSLRGTSPELKDYAHYAGVGKRKSSDRRYEGRRVLRPSVVIPAFLERILEGTGYTYDFIAYRGTNTPMFQINIVKKLYFKKP